MPAQARVDDKIRIDCPHGPQTGIIITGAEREYVDGKKAARKTDKVVCTTCGEIWEIVEGSPRKFTEGQPVARVGDLCKGTCNFGEKCCSHSDQTGRIIEGSPRYFVDG